MAFDLADVSLRPAEQSDDPAAGFAHDETAWELYYRIQLTPFISLQPDLQYIAHPSGSATIDDAVVGTLRLEVLF